MLSLGCVTVSLGEWFPKFQRHRMISKDDGSTAFLHGAGKHSPIVDVAAKTTGIFGSIATISL